MGTGHVHQHSFDAYTGLDSWMHRWEPRLKLAAGLIFVTGVVSVTSHLAAAMALVTAVAAALSSRLSFSFLAARWLPVLPFLAVLTPALSLGGGLGVSSAGLSLALLVSLKTLTAVTIIVMLAGTQPLSTLLQAFAHLRLPHLPVMALFLTFRYLFFFRDEFRSRQRALAARAFQAGPNRRTLSVYGESTAGMLLGALDRSEQVSRAMAARGFDGHVRTSRPRSINYADVAKGTASLAVLAFLILLDRGLPF